MERPALAGVEWESRHAAHATWVCTVRDPADIASEGVRRIVVRHAVAEYEVAPLPDGKWALRYGLEYLSGDCRGRYDPWTAYASREACIAAFLTSAREQFGARLVGVADGVATQEAARTAMLDRLRPGGLFGFIEPEVERGAAG
jgi:hypothetical protein